MSFHHLLKLQVRLSKPFPGLCEFCIFIFFPNTICPIIKSQYLRITKIFLPSTFQYYCNAGSFLALNLKQSHLRRSFYSLLAYTQSKTLFLYQLKCLFCCVNCLQKAYMAFFFSLSPLYNFVQVSYTFLLSKMLHTTEKINYLLTQYPVFNGYMLNSCFCKF